MDAEPRRVPWAEVERLFEGALEQPEAAREAWLREHGGDTPARREVEALLRAHERSGILDGPPPIPDAAVVQPIDQQLGAALAGRYRIERPLGEGGMAQVFLARELKHDRPVVIKALRPEVASWLGADRFLSEIHIAAQLSHPHILALIDSGEADGLLYYVMPYVGGETLRARIADGPMELAEARPLLGDLADALAHAHRHGIVHRDLKPENVLCVGGHAFLMDFGVAKLRPEPGAAGRTAEGLAIGTPAYMAPEQAAGRPVDQRADVYGWGLLAREALLGRLSRDAALARERPDVPAGLAVLVDACLSEDPDGRPRDGAELAARLEEATAAPAPSGGARRFWPLAVVAVVGLGAILVLRDPAPPSLDAVPGPVAVGPLRNETGDTTLSVWGRLAGDWITQGLQETGRVQVIPWPVALEASRRADGDGGAAANEVARLRDETGAGTVVTGSYYLVDGDLRFQVELVDARSGALVAALPAVGGARDSVRRVIQTLRDRLMGDLAVRTDDRIAASVGTGERPPTYEAYRFFERGIELYNQLDYRPAAEALLDAWRADTTYLPPLVFAARAMMNTGQHARVDSLVRSLRARHAGMSQYLDLQVQYLEALIAGDANRALAAIRRAAAAAPDSRAGYNVAFTALSVNQPADALEALRALDPDRGAMRGWAPYWFATTHALHLLGRHEDELAAARELRRRHPDSRAGWVHEARALAALGRVAALDSLLSAAATLAPDTYWSQGAAMVTAGEELLTHGPAQRARRYFDQAERWLANQLVRDPSHRAHRYWLGTTYYDQGRWADAEPYFTSLVDDYPTDISFRGMHALVAAQRGDTAAARRRLGEAPAYERGSHSAYRARVAAAGGDRERAIALLSEALSQGISGLAWLHSAARLDLASLAGDPRFERLRLLATPEPRAN